VWFSLGENHEKASRYGLHQLRNCELGSQLPIFKEKVMKIAVLISRILLGLIFLFFGLNGFFNFLHAPLPPGPAGQYVTLLGPTIYMKFVFLVQLVGGLLLLSGQFLPLALILLGPVIVNILLFHISLQPSGLPPGLLTTVLWFIVFFGVRKAFAGVFAQKVEI
jgi:putative oxidoreductase